VYSPKFFAITNLYLLSLHFTYIKRDKITQNLSKLKTNVN